MNKGERNFTFFYSSSPLEKHQKKLRSRNFLSLSLSLSSSSPAARSLSSSFSPSRATVAPRAKKSKTETKGEMAERRPIDLNAGWSFMERGIHKLKRILENEHEAQFTASHYMNLYT